MVRDFFTEARKLGVFAFISSPIVFYLLFCHLLVLHFDNKTVSKHIEL